jgi:hypothetical protein
MPFASAHIAQIDAAINAATDDPPVGQFGPVTGTHDPWIARAHIKLAVGVAAERELFFEPIHRDLSLFLLSEAGGR